MADLAQHAGEDGAFLVLDGTPDLAEAERAQGAAVALALPDLALHLGDAHLRHLLVVLLLTETDAPLRLCLLLRDRLGGGGRGPFNERPRLFDHSGCLFCLRLCLDLPPSLPGLLRLWG